MRTFDYKRIREIATHPEIYPYVSDDGSPPPEEYEPVQSDEFYYLMFEGGFFLFHPLNYITVEVHTCILPEWRGRSIKYARRAIAWMFRNTQYRKIVTHVPEYNRKALAYAQKAGMRIEGVNRKSFMKNGVIYDQYLLGVVCR